MKSSLSQRQLGVYLFQAVNNHTELLGEVTKKLPYIHDTRDVFMIICEICAMEITLSLSKLIVIY